MSESPAPLPGLKDIASCVAGYDPNSLTVAQAQDFIVRLVQPVQAVEHRALRDALGRVLARDIVSPSTPRTTSAMDGCTARQRARAAGPTRLRLAGGALASRAFEGEVPASTCCASPPAR